MLGIFLLAVIRLKQLSLETAISIALSEVKCNRGNSVTINCWVILFIKKKSQILVSEEIFIVYTKIIILTQGNVKFISRKINIKFKIYNFWYFNFWFKK